MLKKNFTLLVLVAAITVSVSPVFAKKGGNGGGGGDDGGGGGTPPTIGEIVFGESLGTVEIKPDGSNQQLALPLETGDPSNCSFAGGARWYLVVRTTEYLPEFENGVQTGTIGVENIFAVNSITGDEIRVTDFAGDYLYNWENRCRWSRDAGDSLITFMAQDEMEYATVVDGEMGYDFTNYTQPDSELIVIPVSSAMLDAAGQSGTAFTPLTRDDLIFLDYGPRSKDVENFKVSPDLTMGVHLTTLPTTQGGYFFTVFDLATGATLATIPDVYGAPNVDWTPDGNLLLNRTSEGIYLFDMVSLSESLVAPTTRELTTYRDPVISPDGNSFSCRAGRRLKGNNYDHVIVTQNMDGSGQIVTYPASGSPIRWVEE